MPLHRRLPKRGFTNHFMKNYTEIHLSDLEVFDDDTVVTAGLLKEKGIISKINDGVVVLNRGELTKKLTVKVARISGAAKAKIEGLSGKAEVI
jgi:large subunit ribosomal protein L15